MAVFAHILNQTTINSDNSLEAEQNKPFSLWRANNEIKICSIIQSRNSTGNTTIYDPFYDASHITYENYKSSLLRHKNNKENDENRTYYFRCSNPKRNCSCYLTVYVNTVKCSYEIRPNKSEMTHNEKCIQCTSDESQQISEAIKDCRSFTIEFGRKNQRILHTSTMISYIVNEITKYNKQHRDCPILSIKNDTISGWLSIPKPISRKELLFGYIPDEIRRLGGQWVLSELKTVDARIIPLATTKMINISNSVHRLLIDGTFSTAPPGFDQVLNGIGFSMESKSFVPLFHVLITNRKAQTYFDALTEVTRRIEFGSILAINFDFEASLILAIKSLFNEEKTHLHGCLFHFCQALEKNYNSLFGKTFNRNIILSFYYPF